MKAKLLICLLCVWTLGSTMNSAVAEDDFYTDRYETGYDPNGDPYVSQGWDVYADPQEEDLAKTIPFTQNDTSAVDINRIYIASWNIDPPNTIVINVHDDRPYLLYETRIDVSLSVSDRDGDGNAFLRNRRYVENIKINAGENRIPIVIHNEPGQIVSANIVKVKNRSPIKLFD